MTLEMQRYAMAECPWLRGKPGIHRKAKLHLLNLVRPLCHGFWGCNLQQALELFLWMRKSVGDNVHMLRTSSTKGPDYTGVLELLSGSPGCTGFGRVEPLPMRGLVQALAFRFHMALLWPGQTAGVQRWRQDLRFSVHEPPRFFPVRWRSDVMDGEVEQAIADLAALTGRRLRVSPNEHHPPARVIRPVHLGVWPEGFRVLVEYGMGSKDGTNGSVWTLCNYGNAEDLIVDLLRRTKSELEALLTSPEEDAAEDRVNEAVAAEVSRRGVETTPSQARWLMYEGRPGTQWALGLQAGQGRPAC